MSKIVSRVSDSASAVVMRGDSPIRASKLPAPLRFPLVVLTSLTISSMLYSAVSEYTAGELASVSRSLNEWWEVGTLVGLKTLELALGWYMRYDSYDLASLTLLTHGPALYLLNNFYEIRTTTILSSLIIDALTVYIPFRLLRPLSLAHASSNLTNSIPIYNRDVITDIPIQILTTLLAATIYSTTLYGAYTTFLPVTLAIYFDNIPTLSAAHSASLPTLLPLSLILGLGARSFIFTPATAAIPHVKDAREIAFDPVDASLWETIVHNAWGFSKRTKVVVTRTAILMLASGVSTFIQTYFTVEGVEAYGAAVYASVWVVAAAITGASLGLVGAV